VRLIRTQALGICLFLASFAGQSADAASTPASVTLRWTAPGDDGAIGRAARYDLRYSLMPITALAFPHATAVPGLPLPKPAGSVETFTVTGLSAGKSYYFALKTVDDAGNWSLVSNAAFRSAQTTGVDASPLTAEFSAPWPNPARQATRCAYALPEGATVQVDAFDVAGRHLRTIASGWRDAGRGEFEWDLRDDSGRLVGTGVYLLRARLGGVVSTRRLVIAR
jgi:hypothetical protein